jgi:hypothetical protein
MARQSARSFGACKWLLITLTLLLSVFPLIQCRHVSNFPVHEVVGVRLQEESLIGLRIDLVRTDSPLSPFSPGNITSTDRLKRAIKRSQDRLEKLQMSVDEVKAVEATVNAGNGEFLMNMAIGTPSLSFSAILDTGSDLTWTQCKPCTDCYRQPTPIYDPSQSSTYSKVPCSSSLCQALPMYSCTGANCKYLYTYGDQSSTEGILSYESFTLTSQSVPHIAFGCGQDNEGGGFSQGGGLVGFGRGPLSFISQLGQSVGNKFSYCLVSITDSPSKTSPLFIGKTASLNAKTVSSTPLVQSSSQPTFYYLSLEGISVDGQLLDIADGTFDLEFDGTGGVIIDSGTTVTYLEQSGYDVVKKTVISSINLPQVDGSNIGLDLCFEPESGSSTSHFPTITFHFEGADFNLPKENYIYTDSSGIACLAMLPSSGMSIFGNIQQQNYQILYDNERNVLSFAPTVCDTL